MKKATIVLIIILTTVNYVKGQPETIWQLLSNGVVIRWAYSGGDEFNEATLNDFKWQNSYPWGRNFSGTCNQEYMTDGQNIQLSNGVLQLIAKPEQIYALGIPYESDTYQLKDGGPNLRWWQYSSGMIFSKQKFKYGLFEINFKLPTGQGLWPAFWLYGGNPDEEFDIFEYKGETPNKIHYAMHCPACSNFGGWVTANGSFSNGFNSMFGEWSPNYALWYLNGQQFAGWIGNLNYQESLIANLTIANSSPCSFSPGPNNLTPFPAVFEINYIRVFTRLNCNTSYNLTCYNQSATSQTGIGGKTIILGGSTTTCNAILLNGQRLNLIATDEIRLKAGVTIQSGANFTAKIVDCPGPGGKMANNSEQLITDTESLNIISNDFLRSGDTTENYEYSGASVDNKPILYVKIYPNPTEGKIKIEFEGVIDELIKLELINSMGQVVFVENNAQNVLYIDITSFPKGIYFLTGTFGKSVISNKIILK